MPCLRRTLTVKKEEATEGATEQESADLKGSTGAGAAGAATTLRASRLAEWREAPAEIAFPAGAVFQLVAGGGIRRLSAVRVVTFEVETIKRVARQARAHSETWA